jgi:hypothetical protein
VYVEKSKKEYIMKIKLNAIMAITFMFLLTPSVEAKNVFNAGSDVTVTEGQEVKNVVVIGGQVTISGLVEENVLAIAGSVVLTNKAVVRGNVVVVGGIVAKGSGSQVFGDITEINSSTLSEAINSAMRGDLDAWSIILDIISLCFFAIILIIALIMTLLIPRSLAVIANAIQTNKLKSFLCGILVTLLIVPFFMLLVISVIGIFLIPLVFTALLLAAIVGFIAAGSILGNFVITKIYRGYKKSLVKETLAGVFLLWLIGWMPYVGVVVKVLAITSGLGGVLLAFSRRRTSH